MVADSTHSATEAPLQVAVCAYFEPEARAALARTGETGVAIVPFSGRCDERRRAGHCFHSSEHAVPLLCGNSADGDVAENPPFELCFEMLQGMGELEALLAEGCHLLTPRMLQAWPETFAAYGFTAEMARAFYSESVSRFVVLDASVEPVVPAALAELEQNTGRPVEVRRISLDHTTQTLRHLLARQRQKEAVQILRKHLRATQQRNADLGMAYDLLANMPPFPDEAAAVAGLLDLFGSLFAPRAVHYLAPSGENGAWQPAQSYPPNAAFDRFHEQAWENADKHGLLEPDGFHVLVRKGGDILGRVVVDGVAFPDRRSDYLDIAAFVTPVLALFILNGRIHERLRRAEHERREMNVLRAALNAVPAWIAYLDRDGRILLDNNQPLGGFDGQPSADAYWEFLPPALGTRHRALFADCLAGRARPFIEELDDAAGDRLFLNGAYVPILQEDGSVAGVIATISDITEPMRKEREQRDQEAIYHALFDGSRDGILIADGLSRRFHLANPAICRMLGYGADELLRLGLDDIHPAQDLPAARSAIEQGLRSAEPVPLELSVMRKDGSVFPAEMTPTPMRLREKDYLMGTFRDVSERLEAQGKLRLNAVVFRNALEGILITDARGTILDVNDSFSGITGYSREEILGKNPSMLKSGRHDGEFYATLWRNLREQGFWSGEIWNRRKSGEIYAESLTITSVQDNHGAVSNYIAVFSDITQSKLHEQQLERIAHFDALTGIPNRFLLADRMKQAIAHAKREGRLLAVCYLDLDGFKEVNDTLGHEAGDALLIETSKRIVHTIREQDTVARLGGDEFVILLGDLERLEECINAMGRLLEHLGRPFLIKGQRAEVSASIGIALFPMDEEDPDMLLRHADHAMYVAKQAGKNNYKFYDSLQDRKTRDHQAALQRIRQGLAAGEFELFYQPKVSLLTGLPVGAEALIRWRHPQDGLMLPGAFLPFLDDSRLEIELGDWVIDTALAQWQRWQHAGLELSVSINVSGNHLLSDGFVEGFSQRLAAYPDLSPGQFQLEVLETSALEDFEQIIAVMESCGKVGVSFALDDFGTGYSSLLYLRTLPADTLKIDQTFVRNMLENSADLAIVAGVVGLAKTFSRQTVAEGVETPEHFARLCEMGCEVAQGFGIARPMPADQLLAWWRARSAGR